MATRTERTERKKVNSAVQSLRDMCYVLSISDLNDVRPIDIIQDLYPDYDGKDYLKAINSQSAEYAQAVQLVKVYQDMKAASRKFKQLTKGNNSLIKAFLEVQGIPSRR